MEEMEDEWRKERRNGVKRRRVWKRENGGEKERRKATAASAPCGRSE